MKESPIQWTGPTWNIAVGCSKVSEGCKFCYMMRDFEKRPRWSEVNGKVYHTSEVTFNAPLIWHKQGRRAVDGRRLLVFTCSLTDFFHPSIDEYRNEAWDIIRKCPNFIFQILTKRPERVVDCLPEDWGEGWENVWMGVSVENQKRAEERLPLLKDIPAQTKFVSFEPLLGEVDLTELDVLHVDGRVIYAAYDWAIIGGESGNNSGKWLYRECKLEWIQSLVNQHKEAGVPVFLKQFGTHLSKEFGFKDRHGGNIGEWTEQWRIREFPHCYK